MALIDSPVALLRSLDSINSVPFSVPLHQSQTLLKKHEESFPLAVFLPDRTIVGIPHFNQRRPPENEKGCPVFTRLQA